MDKQHTNYAILLADHDVGFHQDFRATFGRYYEVESALSAAKIWEKLKERHTYDLLLLDLHLDGASSDLGLRLMVDIKKKYQSLPVVVISADTGKETAAKAQQMGAQLLVDKNNRDEKYWRQAIESAAAQQKRGLPKVGDKKRSNIEKLPAIPRNKTQQTILVVDDDPRFHADFKIFFEEYYRILKAISPEEMKRELVNDDCDLVFLDLMLDGVNKNLGLDLIPWLRKEYPRVPIIVATADDNTRTITEAMKLGAKSFIQKSDTDFGYWRQQIEEIFEEEKRVLELQQKNKKLAKAEEEIRRLKKEKKADYVFVGEAPKIREIRETLELLSQEPELTVLITGETGVGKEVAARYLHSCGVRSSQPFVAVNLSAIPKTLLESSLFGSVKGGFTDAKDSEGYFFQANGGILMLDEIGDIDHEIQVKLLRFLEQRTIRPVGSPEDIELDVQIITATKLDLNALVVKGLFREDLRYRMNFTIKIPPLRERKEDILPILEHLFKMKYPGANYKDAIHQAVIDRIVAYDWPGNVRQLGNVLAQMMITRKLFKLERADLNCFEEALKQTRPAAIEPPSPITAAPWSAKIGELAGSGRKEQQALEDLSKIEEMLHQTKNDKTDTAKKLGYKGTDHLRSRINVCYKNFPDLFEQFPNIREQYRSIIEE